MTKAYFILWTACFATNVYYASSPSELDFEERSEFDLNEAQYQAEDDYERDNSDYNDSPEMRADVRMNDFGDHLYDDHTYHHEAAASDGGSKRCDIPWECNRPCPIGYFRLQGMETCHRWLECSDWNELSENRTYLTQGSMKRVFKADWRGTPVIVARVKRFKYFSFINNLRSLQPSVFVTQLIGACEDPAWPEVVLEYHPRGRLGNLPAVLEMTPKLASPHLLMRLLVDYAAVLSVLHHREPEGSRVLCDTWSLQKITHQFLLTRDFRLLLNDVDDVSLVIPSKSRLARCSAGFYTRPELLDPDFLAPEEFSQGYFDQSVDIYKAPAVAQWILEWAGPDGQELLRHLEPIHRLCKSPMPSDRPTAERLLDEYRKAYDYAKLSLEPDGSYGNL